MNRRLSRPIATIAVGWFLSFLLAFSGQAQAPNAMPNQAEAARQEQQGSASYRGHEFQLAVQAWQEAAQTYQRQGDSIAQARVLSNLALAYQQLGLWPEAEGAIAASWQLLKAETGPTPPGTLAQILTNQGTLQYAGGKAEAALLTWHKAEAAYDQAGDRVGSQRSQINQAQALQALGFYSRACQRLVQSLQLPTPICQEASPETKAALTSALQHLPPTLNPIQVAGWRNLGEVLLTLGQLSEAQQVLETIAARLRAGEERATLLLSLGNLALAKQELPAAATFYQEGAEIARTPATRLSSQLAQLNVSLQSQQWARATSLLPALQENLAQLPPSHLKVSAQINFVQQLIRIRQKAEIPEPWRSRWPTEGEMAAILADARQQAQRLGDGRSESYALGSLGLLAETASQWAEAQQWTEQALLLAQAINAPEATYRWQWQLGRILAAKGQREQAILAYSEAIATLESIRGDLVANRELGFSFQENVEPAYRELVSLLLQPDSQGEVPQANLKRARDVMEALQQAELTNFFRQDCLEAKPIGIDEIDPQAAVFYSLVLSDRLAVILSLPHQPLRYYSTPVSAEVVESAAAEMRYQLVIRSQRGFFEPARQFYDWLVRPAAAALADSGTQTLVFVLDGALRNIPMAALSDGKSYLIEQYAIALTPGLELLNPSPLASRGLNALAVGLQEARQGFSPLYYVGQELAAIGKEVPSTILLNQQFTKSAFADAIADFSFPIVHIATHGQFSSNIDQTFILAWDGTVNLRQLDDLLRVRNLNREGTLELLVLSACETAVGDKRATLGLAGTAVQSGARSTIATLWPVNDEASTELMQAFYGNLASRQSSKAQAIRQAQLTLLKSGKYNHPFYWGAYILLGNWL